jgi:DNA modification methylase
MELNKIYQQPCMETLSNMPDNYLDCVVTSPPYWQLRDYGYEGQWGLEPTYQEYLQHLWEMMDLIYKKLKPEGTCWINLGDSYYEKCLLLLPHRFAVGCIDRNWIMRNDCIWAKRNAMPESTTDRLSKKHEYFFFMVKSENYFFDLDAIRDKATALEQQQGFQFRQPDFVDIGKPVSSKEKPQYSVLDKEFRNQVVEVRNLPDHNEMRTYLSDARKSAGMTIDTIENLFGTQAPHHWFEKNGSYPSAEDWKKLKAILIFDSKFDEQMTTIDFKSGLKQDNPLGKNPGSVSDFWDINTKPSSNKHYASYNDELIKKPVLAGCPEGGIIYDPFMGTGSTAEVCLRTNRNYIGSEMSAEYCKIAEERLTPFKNMLF